MFYRHQAVSYSSITAGSLLAVLHLDIPCKWAERKTFHLGRKLTAIIMKSMYKLLYIKKIKQLKTKLTAHNSMSHINSDISRQFHKDGFSIYITYDVSDSSGMQLRREEIIPQQNEVI